LTLTFISRFILDNFPNIWIHSINDKQEPGTIKIKLSGINEQQQIELIDSLHKILPAGIRVDLKIASTTSEFFKAGKIRRDKAPWRDIV